MKVLETMRVTLCATVVMVTAGLEELWACTVCFGAAESPVLEGLNLSIVFLLGLTYVIIFSFGGFFLYLLRREKLFMKEEVER